MKHLLRKSLVWLMTICMILALLPISALAAEDTVFVDATYDASTPNWGITAFATIQNGIAAVASAGRSTSQRARIMETLQ